MTKAALGIALLGVMVLVMSCATLRGQEMSYLGDVSSKEVVVGSSWHVDSMGLGNSPRSYADAYHGAVSDAFQNSPEGTTVLRNLKGMKNTFYLPQAVGVAFMGAGATSVAQGENYRTPVPYFIGAVGVLLALIDVYEYVVIAEPSKDQ